MEGSNQHDGEQAMEDQRRRNVNSSVMSLGEDESTAGSDDQNVVSQALHVGYTISRSVSAAPPETAFGLHGTPKQGATSSRLGRSASLKNTKVNSSSGPDTVLPPQSSSSTGLGAQSHPALNSEYYHPSDSRLSSTASSPRVFTPKSSPLRQDFPHSDASEPYSSPYLQYTHRHAPKETHLAEVERDPISGRKMINHYEIISELGRGVHGKVKLGRNLQTGDKVAIKIVERVSKRRRLGRTGDQEAKIKREIAILKKARHPNIVGLREVIDDPAKKKVYIVLEFVELGEVEWRTRGEDEICIIESRRNKRESEGISENNAESQYDEHILETARRHLERREEVEGVQTQRHSMEVQENQAGSGGLEQSIQDAKGESASATPRERSRTTAFILDSWDDSDGLPDSLDHSGHVDLPEALEPAQADTHGVSEGTHAVEPVDALSDFHAQSNTHADWYPVALEGIMYGAYDTSQYDRELSLGSFQSSRDDFVPARVSEEYRYVPTMTLSEALRAIRDTVLGLEYLHYQGVVHRDIKPANLLQTKDHRVKISDFGVSYLGKPAVHAQSSDDQSESEAPDFDEALELAKTVGTPAFYAPELCTTDLEEADDPPPVTNAIDVWALGVTLYCLVFGRLPFHDNNTFALMRRIAEQDVHIPRKRLKAVVMQRDPSTLFENEHGSNDSKRQPLDLEYEDVSDELYDLLKRLLVKDPRKRIKLTEVKHHPWLLSGIQDPGRWIDESDPSRITDGKKIEVSKEDVDVAVVTNLGDHIISIASKGLKKMAGAFGIGKTHSRRRAKSAADTAPSSTASSSSTISQDAKRYEQRRPSVRTDEVMISALKTSREAEHPLSQSVTASPEIREYSSYFRAYTGPDSSTQRVDTVDDELPERPSSLERGFSAADSVRTIRQSDIAAITDSMAARPATFPSSPQALDHDKTSISGIFGGAKRKLFRNIHNRDTDGSRGRILSSDLFSSADEHSHSEPSIAVSTAVAAGLVNPPASLQEDSHSSNTMSPMSSRAPSLGGQPDLTRARENNEGMSRQSSLSSVTSKGWPSQTETHGIPLKAHFIPLLPGISDQAAATRQSPALDSAEEQLARAKEEQFRRLIQEEQHHRRSPIFEHHATSSVPQSACPPSPDDIFFAKRQPEAMPSPDEFLTLGPSASDTNPAHDSAIMTRPSDDQFTSGMSQSTSNPSLPSAYSANSSVTADEIAHYSIGPSKLSFGSQHDQTKIMTRPNRNGDEEYPHGHEDNDYSSDDSFIEMASKRKNRAGQHGRSTSHPVTPSITFNPQQSPFAEPETEQLSRRNNEAEF